MAEVTLSAEASATGAAAGRQRWALVAALYLAQSIPSYLLIMAVPAALRSLGLGLDKVGMLSVLMLPLILKFLWAPLVDRTRFGRLGHRRGWVVITQLCTSAGIALLAFSDPSHITAVLLAGMLIALSIATQDIATDGYATRLLRPSERAAGNGIQAGAVAVGVLLGGTLSMWLFERWGWSATLLLMASLSLLPLAALPWMRESPVSTLEVQERASLRRFFQRPGAWSILGLALVYRASEGMVRTMESSYLMHNGLRLSEAGGLLGSSATVAGLIGSILGARWLMRSTPDKVLLSLSGMRVACYLLFGIHALGMLAMLGPMGHTPILGFLAMSLSMLRYMEMVGLYALFMEAASPRQPGTDFSVLVCAELLSYMLSAMAGGYIAKQLGFAAMFGVATALALLSWWAARTLLARYRKVLSHDR